MITNPKAIHIGNKVYIRKGARLEAVGRIDGKNPKIIIGDNTSIHFYFHCGAAESIIIGNDVLIAGRVYITDHDHVFDDPDKPARWSGKLVTKPIVIENGSWLGEGVIILKGVTIGQRAVIGANSVVTRDIPPFSVAVGNPAKVIRNFSPDNMSREPVQ
jgi:acetyltransferase-like isoleucine patch superfamily enzyme